MANVKRDKRFHAGQLDRPIELIFVTESGTSESGTPQYATSTLQAWARVFYAKGKESNTDRSSKTTQRVIFEIRYEDEIDGLTKVEYRGKEYDVEDIREVGRDNLMQLGTKLTE